MKVTEPVAAAGETVAVSNTLLPEGVPAAGIAAPPTLAVSAVVVLEVTVTLDAEEVLGASVALPP
jgi:hypothetical protein